MTCDENSHVSAPPKTATLGPMYPDRDYMAQGQHYIRHVDAMTREVLHAKSRIAGELAARDIEIEQLRRGLADATDPKPIGLVVRQTKALVDERDRLRAALIAVIERAERKMGWSVSDDVCKIARMALGPNVAINLPP